MTENSNKNDSRKVLRDEGEWGAEVRGDLGCLLGNNLYMTVHYSSVADYWRQDRTQLILRPSS